MASHLHLAPPPEGRAGGAPDHVRVVLADDQDLVRRSLGTLLAGDEDIKLVGEAGDISAALNRVRSGAADVLVLDIGRASGTGVDAILELRRRAPGVRIVILAMDDSPLLVQRALANGAHGFVLKDRADAELADAVRSVASGEVFVSPQLAARVESLERSLAKDRLTARETQVLRLVALGHTSVEIAAELGVSARTVETHRAHVHDKLRLATRAELVRYALGRGLLRV